MRAFVLDGASQGFGARVGRELQALLSHADFDVRCLRAAEELLAPCQGDFDCWSKAPGICRIKDSVHEVVRQMHDSAVTLLVSEVTFGGQSAELKRAVDRLICLILPFFQRMDEDGLTHHQRRYLSYPALIHVGVDAAPSAESAAIFRELGRSQARNLGAPWQRSLMVTPGDPSWRERLEVDLRRALAEGPTDPGLDEREDLRLVLDDACRPGDAGDSPARPPSRAALLVGSGRPRGQSNSEALGRALLTALEAEGVQTSTVHSISFLKDGRAADEALATLRSAELLVVSCPVYVDTLPALATKALERLAATRASRECGADAPARPKVLGIVNCGFPEAVHARTAVRVLRAFTRQIDGVWAGALVMGGGEVINGRPLEAVGGVVRKQRTALSEAAAALAAGQTIPDKAIHMMQTTLIPHILYRWFGTLGWHLSARRAGLPRDTLRDRPLDGRSLGSHHVGSGE